MILSIPLIMTFSRIYIQQEWFFRSIIFHAFNPSDFKALGTGHFGFPNFWHFRHWISQRISNLENSLITTDSNSVLQYLLQSWKYTYFTFAPVSLLNNFFPSEFQYFPVLHNLQTKQHNSKSTLWLAETASFSFSNMVKFSSHEYCSALAA